MKNTFLCHCGLDPQSHSVTVKILEIVGQARNDEESAQVHSIRAWAKKQRVEEPIASTA
jgi:hypothetical protein